MDDTNIIREDSGEEIEPVEPKQKKNQTNNIRCVEIFHKHWQRGRWN